MFWELKASQKYFKHSVERERYIVLLKPIITALLFFTFLTGLVVMCPPKTAYAGLFINEFIADNDSIISDPEEPNSFEDWIEIYNSGNTDVSMSGMYLTDEPADPAKWCIPAGVSIPAQGYLLFWADDDEEQGPTHTNFKLTAEGEAIELIAQDGMTLIDSITFGPQIVDISYGRYPDGTGDWGFMTPTPEAPNNHYNIPPSITRTIRTPLLPEAGEAVCVTCIVTDESTISSVTLSYNTGNGFEDIRMWDDGAHNDGGIMDNIFGAMLPAFGKNTIVKYYITATDDLGGISRDPFNPAIELYLYVVGYSPPKLFINEFMADNISTIENPDKAESFEDWIEIYNADDMPIDMGGMYLTDNLENPTKWMVPVGIIIPSKDCLLFWADSNENQGVMHTNFKLDKDGEEIGLFAITANGNMTIDKVIFGEQSSDVSYSRIYDYGASWAFAKYPTPGETNYFPGGTYTCNFSYPIDSFSLIQKSVCGIDSVSNYNTVSGRNDSCYIFFNNPCGHNFSIHPGNNYFVSMPACLSPGAGGSVTACITEILATLSSMPMPVPAFDMTYIQLQNSSISINGNGAMVNGNIINIHSAGTYSISGTLTDGQVIVNTADADIVEIILNAANIACSTSAPIYVINAKDTVITLADATENFLTDNDAYLFENADSNEPDAAIFSRDDLTINGNGALAVNANYKDGISSKDDLKITGGNITVNAVNNGIRGRDSVTVKDGIITVTSGNYGILSNNDEEMEKGNILIEGGKISIDSSKGIKSVNNMIIEAGDININAFGGVVLEASGSGYNPSYCSALKCNSNINITGGNIYISHTGIAGKGISSDKDINISGGSIDITTLGGGATYKNSSGVTDYYNATCITADGNITILGASVTTYSSGSAGKCIIAKGKLTIGDSINSPTLDIITTGTKFVVSGSGRDTEYATPKAITVDGAITINNGTTTISSTNDALKSNTSITINNADVSIINSVEGIESPYITVNNANVAIEASDDGFNATKGIGGEAYDGSCLSINGGNVYVNVSGGDGLDSNGDIVITSGTIIVHGPRSQPEVGMDYNGTCNISGGFLVISGTNSNMTEAPSNTSAQHSIKATTYTSIPASTIFHIQNTNGNDILTFRPLRNYYSIVFSSPELTAGSTYYIYTGGSSTGTETNGLYTGGTYSGGTQRKSFTIYNKVTNVSF